MNPEYRHTQRAPMCIVVYAVGLVFLTIGWFARDEVVLQWLFPIACVVTTIMAATFHHLTVEDVGDHLSIRFGPVPLFQRSILYTDITAVETSRTTIAEGWGIHLSHRGGWIWNLWGRDCVVLHLGHKRFTIGTDDAKHLNGFLQRRLENSAEHLPS